MINLVMMALGTFRFGVSQANYQTFQRSASYRWDEVARQGRLPALQYAGPGTETITLQGTIYPAFRGGLRQLEVMRFIADQAEPLMLVDGIGFVWQRWVILNVEETKKLLMADGAPRQIDFKVELQRYGGDQA